MNIEQLIIQSIPFLLLGILAGGFAGLLGIGGGTIVVSGLLLIFRYGHFNMITTPMHTASATSLTIMVLTTGASFLSHWRLGNVHPYTYKRMIIGIVAGVIVGVSIAVFLPNRILEKIFALLLIGIAIYMFIKNNKPKRQHKVFPSTQVPAPLLIGFATLIGAKSGLLGIGGGLMTVPFLRHTHLKMRQAIGTSSAISLSIAVSGTTTYLIYSLFFHIPATHHSYIYWPAVWGVGLSSVFCAPLGAFLSSRMSTRILSYIFAVLLLVIGLDTLFSS